MTVASRAVAMAVMTEARAVDVEQEAKLEPMLVESIVLGFVIPRLHFSRFHFSEVCSQNLRIASTG